MRTIKEYVMRKHFNENGNLIYLETENDLVRCKDCKWKQGSECVRFAEVRPLPDDFCSRAERKEDKDGE